MEMGSIVTQVRLQLGFCVFRVESRVGCVVKVDPAYRSPRLSRLFQVLGTRIVDSIVFE